MLNNLKNILSIKNIYFYCIFVVLLEINNFIKYSLNIWTNLKDLYIFFV